MKEITQHIKIDRQPKDVLPGVSEDDSLVAAVVARPWRRLERLGLLCRGRLVHARPSIAAVRSPPEDMPSWR